MSYSIESIDKLVCMYMQSDDVADQKSVGLVLHVIDFLCNRVTTNL